MINLEGIEKPSFHAFKFLSRLGGEDVESDDSQSWITRSKDGSVQVLVWDYSPVVPPTGKTDQVFYKQELAPTGKGGLTLDIAHIPDGRYKVAVYQIGYKQNDPYTAYLEMGSPSQLTRSQVEALKKISTGEPSSKSEVSVTGGHFTRTLPLRTNDCFEVVLTPIASGR
jgi:xylan 1,4-beta-xylosidase